MTHAKHTEPAAAHTSEPWDYDGATTLYATPHESDEITMIEVRANVTEAGWDTVAFVEAIWPGSTDNARRICAAVNACQGLSTEALEQGVVQTLRQALGTLLTAAADLDAAIDGVTDQFDDERAGLDAAYRIAGAACGGATGEDPSPGTEIDLDELRDCRGQIALIWSVEDVQEVRPDLTDEQALEVLKKVERRHDATLGVSWETLEMMAEDLFGDAPETDEA